MQLFIEACSSTKAADLIARVAWNTQSFDLIDLANRCNTFEEILFLLALLKVGVEENRIALKVEVLIKALDAFNRVIVSQHPYKCNLIFATELGPVISLLKPESQSNLLVQFCDNSTILQLVLSRISPDVDINMSIFQKHVLLDILPPLCSRFGISPSLLFETWSVHDKQLRIAVCIFEALLMAPESLQLSLAVPFIKSHDFWSMLLEHILHDSKRCLVLLKSFVAVSDPKDSRWVAMIQIFDAVIMFSDSLHLAVAAWPNIKTVMRKSDSTYRDLLPEMYIFPLMEKLYHMGLNDTCIPVQKMVTRTFFQDAPNYFFDPKYAQFSQDFVMHSLIPSFGTKELFRIVWDDQDCYTTNSLFNLDKHFPLFMKSWLQQKLDVPSILRCYLTTVFSMRHSVISCFQMMVDTFWFVATDAQLELGADFVDVIRKFFNDVLGFPATTTFRRIQHLRFSCMDIIFKHVSSQVLQNIPLMVHLLISINATSDEIKKIRLPEGVISIYDDWLEISLKSEKGFNSRAWVVGWNVRSTFDSSLQLYLEQSFKSECQIVFRRCCLILLEDFDTNVADAMLDSITTVLVKQIHACKVADSERNMALDSIFNSSKSRDHLQDNLSIPSCIYAMLVLKSMTRGQLPLSSIQTIDGIFESYGPDSSSLQCRLGIYSFAEISGSENSRSILLRAFRQPDFDRLEMLIGWGTAFRLLGSIQVDEAIQQLLLNECLAGFDASDEHLLCVILQCVSFVLSVPFSGCFNHLWDIAQAGFTAFRSLKKLDATVFLLFLEAFFSPPLFDSDEAVNSFLKPLWNCISTCSFENKYCVLAKYFVNNIFRNHPLRARSWIPELLEIGTSFTEVGTANCFEFVGIECCQLVQTPFDYIGDTYIHPLCYPRHSVLLFFEEVDVSKVSETWILDFADAIFALDGTIDVNRTHMGTPYFSNKLALWHMLAILASRKLSAYQVKSLLATFFGGVFQYVEAHPPAHAIRYVVQLFLFHLGVQHPHLVLPLIVAHLGEYHIRSLMGCELLMLVSTCILSDFQRRGVALDPVLVESLIAVTMPLAGSKVVSVRYVVFAAVWVANSMVEPTTTRNSFLLYITSNKKMNLACASFVKAITEFDCYEMVHFRKHISCHLPNPFGHLRYHSLEKILEGCRDEIFAQFVDTNETYTKKPDAKPPRSIETIVGSTISQQKIDPWAGMSSIGKKQLREAVVEDCTRQSLVVVASLLTDVPSIAALVRSCEIFRVQEFIVEDVSVKTSKEFLAIAVSSENWLPITECPVEKLSQKISAFKMQGYNVVGLGYGSTSLSNYEFQEKVVLVVGYPIPMNILNMCDSFVKIPSVGHTQSLNTHIEGAVAVWEYTKHQAPWQ